MNDEFTAYSTTDLRQKLGVLQMQTKNLESCDISQFTFFLLLFGITFQTEANNYKVYEEIKDETCWNLHRFFSKSVKPIHQYESFLSGKCPDAVLTFFYPRRKRIAPSFFKNALHEILWNDLNLTLTKQIPAKFSSIRRMLHRNKFNIPFFVNFSVLN